MQPRLNIDLLLRALRDLYVRDRFANKNIACGRFALSASYGFIAAGAALGFISGIVTGAESLGMHVFWIAFVSALLANLLAMVWIAAARAAKPAGVPPVTNLERRAPVAPPAFISVCLRPASPPPRSLS